LPEPVGAQISVWLPRAMAGQPRAWADVGSANDALNQSRVAGVNAASGSGAGSSWGVLETRRGTGGEYIPPAYFEQAIGLACARDPVAIP